MNQWELNQQSIGNGEPSFRQFLTISVITTAVVGMTLTAYRVIVASVVPNASMTGYLSAVWQLAGSTATSVTMTFASTTAYAKYLMTSVLAKATAVFEKLLGRLTLSGSQTGSATGTCTAYIGYGRYVVESLTARATSSSVLNGEFLIGGDGVMAASSDIVLSHWVAVPPSTLSASASGAIVMVATGVPATDDRRVLVPSEDRIARV